jgi:hypothetical protein
MAGAVTYIPTKRTGTKGPSQELILLELLKRARTDAFALAHGYDVGGHPDQAWRLVSVGDRIGDAIAQLNDISQMLAPKRDHAASSLQLRASPAPTTARASPGEFGRHWCRD